MRKIFIRKYHLVIGISYLFSSLAHSGLGTPTGDATNPNLFYFLSLFINFTQFILIGYTMSFLMF